MRKILLSPLFIIVLLVIIGAGGAIASILIGGGGSGTINLQKGLVGHWKFDGNAKDATPNSNHGTVTGATLTTDRKGQSNKAYSFNGTTNYVGAPLVTTSKTNVSISAWFKTLNPNQAGQMVVYIGSDASGNGYGFAVNNEGDTNGTLRLLRGAIAWIDTGVRISDSNWHHVVMVVGPASEFTSYFDGVLVYGPTAGSLNTPTLRTDIGRNDYPAARYFNGSIDDVRIYNRAIAAAEITALYESYNPGIVVSDLQKGLVGHWKFDGNSKDSTPNSNHGTVTGATLTTDRKGQSNKAYSFNGSSYIIIPSFNQGSTSVTIAAWVYASSYNGDYQIVDKAPVNSNWDLFAYYNTIWLRGAGGDGSSRVTAPSTNAWHHIVGTISGTTGVIYIDGIGTTTTVTAIPNDTQEVNIGSYVRGGSPFNGLIDDVRIYNRALSATEVTALYESYNPGIVVSDLQKGLVGHWKLDGNAKDATPNSNHGTVTGATLTTDRKGQSNKAYSFNGANNYVNLPNLGLSGNVPFSISFWTNPTSSSNIQEPFSFNGAEIVRNYPAVNELTLYNGAARITTTFPSSGAWHQIVFVSTGSSLAFYVDGTQSGTTVSYSASVTNSSYGIGWSRPQSTYYYNGLIDDVRIYNRALSATEITALYESYQ